LNPKQEEIYTKLLSIKNFISKLAAYKLYDIHKIKVNQILNQQQIKHINYSKIIYHLCVAAYYLTEKTPDKVFLRNIKNCFTQNNIDKIICCLETGSKYIADFPIDYKEELINLYKQF
jgi:hypothetical protein